MQILICSKISLLQHRFRADYTYVGLMNLRVHYKVVLVTVALITVLLKGRGDWGSARSRGSQNRGISKAERVFKSKRDVSVLSKCNFMHESDANSGSFFCSLP